MECFVSYAWDDATPEGRDREAIVDQPCEAAATAGITIIRDKTTLHTGDSIARFMQSIGRGDRVFAILSDKYLKSGSCMYELCEIWRNSKWDDQDFLSRARIYSFPDAAIFGLEQRLDHATFWKRKFERINDRISQEGPDIFGLKDFHRFRLLRQFYLNVSEMLATVAGSTDLPTCSRPPPRPQNPDKRLRYDVHLGAWPNSDVHRPPALTTTVRSPDS